jgi:predicted nucleotidyltransferase
MYRHIEYLKKTRKDLEENLEKYLSDLKSLAEKHGGKAYIFGSYLRGGNIAASDIDILIEIPDNIDRLSVLHEARKVAPNTRIEIDVLNKRDAEIFKELIKDYKEITQNEKYEK